MILRIKTILALLIVILSLAIVSLGGMKTSSKEDLPILKASIGELPIETTGRKGDNADSISLDAHFSSANSGYREETRKIASIKTWLAKIRASA